MKIISWNCRGFGSPSIVPQLNEFLRLLKPKLVLLYETKRKKNLLVRYVGSVDGKIGGMRLNQLEGVEKCCLAGGHE